MFSDERGVVREESGIELPEDAGDIEATVFSKGMVAVDEEHKKSERGELKQPARSRPG